MKISLDKLRFQGEECSNNNRDKPISEQQFKTILLIKEHFKDIFNGKTFGDAWDFIKCYAGKPYIDVNGKEKTLFKLSSINGEINWESFRLENTEAIDEPDIDFQEDYFQSRYKALQKGEVWYKDDRISDELTDDPY